MTFARHLAAAALHLDRQLADRYGSTAVTVDAATPAPLPLPEVDAYGSSHHPALHHVDVTPAMVAAVDAYLASKSADERAELDALMGVPATARMRRVA